MEIWTEEQWRKAESRDPTKRYIEPEQANRLDVWLAYACFIAMGMSGLVLVWMN
jgi:hypothetical protein